MGGQWQLDKDGVTYLASETHSSGDEGGGGGPTWEMLEHIDAAVDVLPSGRRATTRPEPTRPEKRKPA